MDCKIKLKENEKESVKDKTRWKEGGTREENFYLKKSATNLNQIDKERTPNESTKEGQQKRTKYTQTLNMCTP